MSFEVMLRNDWFVRNPYLEPGLIAMLIAFVPTGPWAVGGGCRSVPTGQVVGLRAAVGAAVVFVDHLFVGVFGIFQGMTPTATEIARWADAALGIMGTHTAADDGSPAGVAACQRVEAAVHAVATLVGVRVAWLLMPQPLWAAFALFAGALAVIHAARARHSWSCLRALHDAERTG